MPNPDFVAFRNRMLAAGFDEVVERNWPPNAVVETHSHPFAVDALLVAGEMWLEVAGITQHLRAGETFTLAAEVQHAERYGPLGATYWVARRKLSGER